jgi:succinate dehydrogenase / fumarate reductase, membrane anchor subunit
MSADLRTPLGRIRGLGSSKSGTKDFIHQRMTAAALVPLSFWFLIAALAQIGASQAQAAAFLGNPVNAVLMFLFLSSALYHMSIGLQTVIEDYVHTEGLKLLLLLFMRISALAIGATAGLSLVRLALAGH